MFKVEIQYKNEEKWHNLAHDSVPLFKNTINSKNRFEALDNLYRFITEWDYKTAHRVEKVGLFGYEVYIDDERQVTYRVCLK